jgi:CyaY protein
MDHMDRKEFIKLADQCLARVVQALEPFDPDEVDFSESDGVVTIEFPDNARYILNRQAAADQMWFAAGARAWHYDWDADASRWIDDRDGHELLGRVAESISEKIGRTVTL